MSKTDIPKEGIFLGKNSKGFYIRVKENGHILCTFGGYNTKASAWKGLRSIRHNLIRFFKPLSGLIGEFDHTDLTKPVRKSVTLKGKKK